MVSAFGNELGLRILEADPPILSLNIYAMWWDEVGGTECAYMANLARQLNAALSGGKLGAPIEAATCVAVDFRIFPCIRPLIAL
jgi:hypothetical protein